ncbi:aldehyde dehydrogenase family protein, partial [Pseudomonas proteolytica]|uniref:aldehyde dehydrogenase family protein n=1 Tax=Pseudomonas proteolytica TaxID=219574 RepID=UPI0030DA7530
FQGSAGSAVVLAESAAIFTDGRYTLQLREQVSADDWQYVAVPASNVARWLGEHAPAGGRIGYDPWLHTSAWVADARAKGATVETVNPANEDFAGSNARKMPLHIVRNATDDMIVMQEELFGPILPVRRYTNIDSAIAEVNRRDRPLGLYYYGPDESERRTV